MRAQPSRATSAPLSGRVAHFVRSLPDHQLLDRLVRGRAWIPVLGVMLAGIVAMQVEVLKLNASMGRSIELASSLQARNELLQSNVSALSDAHRIERLAVRMGMVMPGPTSVDFLHGRASAARAAAGIHAPDTTAFDSALQASALQAAAATTPAPATSTSSSTSTSTPALSTTTSPAATPTTTSTATPTTTSMVTPSPTTGTGAAGAASTSTSGAAGATATTPSASATATTGGAAPSG